MTTEVDKNQNANKDKAKSHPFWSRAVGTCYLKALRVKHSLGQKSVKAIEEEKLSDRVCSDVYSPFVKKSFRRLCDLHHIEEGPMGCLRRATSMAELFREAVIMHREKPCLGYRPMISLEEVKQPNGKKLRKIKQGFYKFFNYEYIDALVESYGRGIRSMGVEPRQNVVILADTCFEWMCIAQALMRFNIAIVTVYATLSEEGIIHGIEETQAVMLVTTQEMLENLRERFAEISSLHSIVYIGRADRAKVEPIATKTVMSIDELRVRGEKATTSNLPDEKAQPTDTAIVMYTSGSTGNPKGVILSHRNMLAAARGLSETFETINAQPDDAYIAYLPLAHVFEINCEMISLLYGVRIGYSSAQTLTDSGTLLAAKEVGDCTLLRPTIMVSVPLVLDRVKKAIEFKVNARGPTAACALDLAVEELKKRFKNDQDTSVYDPLMSKIRTTVGGRLRFIATGSAPLSPDTHSFIRAALGCIVLQGYGLTETCAAATCMDSDDKSTSEVGTPVSGAYIKLDDWPEGGYFVKEGRGEIIIGGEMISEGYFKNEELTKESFFTQDNIRWFRTGDIGEVTNRGTFKIIDRKKDLIKLQHGEYISLGKIETEMKTLAIVENICVYGDSLQTSVVALVQPNRAQLDILADRLGRSNLSIEELAEDELIVENVLEMIKSHGRAKHFNRVEIPVKLKICSEEWTPESNMVTAAFKLRRAQIYQKYKTELDNLYK